MEKKTRKDKTVKQVTRPWETMKEADSHVLDTMNVCIRSYFPVGMTRKGSCSSPRAQSKHTSLPVRLQLNSISHTYNVCDVVH